MADRILQLTGTTTGGAGRHALDLTRSLRESGYDVLLAGPGSVIAGSAPPTAAVDIAELPRLRDAAAVATIRRLSRRARIVHAHGLRAGALAAVALLGRPARGPRATALVVTWHNKPVGSTRVRFVGRVLERLIALRAQCVLGVSGDLVRRAADLGIAHTERALVPAPSGDHPEPTEGRLRGLRAELGLDPQAPVILTLARLAPQKGLDLLACSAQLLKLSNPRARWLVAGDGPLRAELAERARAHELPLQLLGHRTDVADLLALADVVVSTSSWEGQPLNVQEALRAGRPIVATDVGGTAEVTGSAAILVPYGDAGAVAAQIERVLRDAELADDLARSARERAAELPTARDTLDQVCRCYAALLE